MLAKYSREGVSCRRFQMGGVAGVPLFKASVERRCMVPASTCLEDWCTVRGLKSAVTDTWPEACHKPRH